MIEYKRCSRLVIKVLSGMDFAQLRWIVDICLTIFLERMRYEVYGGFFEEH